VGQETFSSSEVLLLHNVELMTSPIMYSYAVQHINYVPSITTTIQRYIRRMDGHEWLWNAI
jgi:hypothetical protein